MQLVAEFRRAGVSIPFILVTEDANEETVAEIIESGPWNCAAKSQLDGDKLVRTIHNTLGLHMLPREQQSAQESLRKLSGAVEQFAGTVLIPDGEGRIQYVNPAFERLTSYAREETCGKPPCILKSSEQGPETYQEMWKTLLEGKVCRGILVNRKKNGDLYYAEESISLSATPTVRSLTLSPTGAISPNACVLKLNSYKRRRRTPLEDLRAALRMTSTIFWRSSPVILNWLWMQPQRTARLKISCTRFFLRHDARAGRNFLFVSG